LNNGIAFLLFGYGQGVFGGLLGNPLFLKTFHNPDATIQGQIVSTRVHHLAGWQVGNRRGWTSGIVHNVLDV
jgi:hypothetical protein